MSARSLSLSVFALLGVLAQGCAAADDAAVSDTEAPRVSEEATDYLELVDAANPLAMVTGGTRDVRVKLLDRDGRPRDGEYVSFGILGDAPGASLSTDLATTDANGIATVRVRAGSNQFTLRASARSAMLLVSVTVAGSKELSASVAVTYNGKRAIASRTLTLVAGGTCTLLSGDQSKQNLRSAPTSVLFNASERATFKLQPDQAYALLAWGSDETNSRLASGCVDLPARPATSDANEAVQELSIELDDNGLALTASTYDQLLTLTLVKALEVLAPTARAAVQARLPVGNDAAAQFYLNVIKAGEPSLVAALDQRAAELSSELQKANAGPLAFADALTGVVVTRGGEATVAGTLDLARDGTMASFQLLRLFSRAQDGSANEIILDSANLSKQVVFTGSYDADLAALQIGSMALRFGLGSYTLRVLGSAGTATQLAASLAPVSGCAQVAKVLSTVVATERSDALCQASLASLVNDISAAWGTLDTQRSTILLTGQLPVHDRDNDGKVDDVGPSSLNGSWSNQLGTPDVKAMLRVPPTTALVL